jgi:prepilin-type N-terminal cleavage/methylation domain-containing protein
MRSPETGKTRFRVMKRKGDGFTIIELLVALAILGIVLGALAPAFYEALTATALTNERSVANGLAVAAVEQMRSLPYANVGYLNTPSSCVNGTQSWNKPLSDGETFGSSNAVTMSSSTALDTDAAAAPQVIGNISYSTLRCVYWVDSSVSADTVAYKEVEVLVSWKAGATTYHVTQSSALYPGGETTYSPENNFPPGGTTTTTAVGIPPTPTIVSATPDSTTGGLDVEWQPVSWTSSVQYWVEYWTGSSSRPTDPAVASNAPVNGIAATDNPSNLEYQVTGLTPGTVYYFDVFSVASGGAESTPSAVASGTTPGTVVTTTTTLPGPTTTVSGPTTTTSTTAPPACVVSSIVVNPASPPVSQQKASAGQLANSNYLAVTVNASTVNCSGLSVKFALSGGTAYTVALTPNSGTWTGQAGVGGYIDSAGDAWATSTYTFTVYQGSSAFLSPVANVTPCAESGNSGHC